MRTQLDETRQVFEDLRAYVAEQPELSALLPVTIELEQQAEDLASGWTEIGPLTTEVHMSTLSRVSARAIVQIVSRLPPIGQHLSDEIKLGLARLLENLVVGVTGTVFLEFPDLVPRRKPRTSQQTSMRKSAGSSHGVGFLSFAEFRSGPQQEAERYPFSIPAINSLREQRLEFSATATIFVGENGCGKSTIVEAISVAAGFNPEGGTSNFQFSTRSSESALHRCVRLARTHRRPRTGFFFRAESFFNVATKIEELDREPARAPPIIDSYGARSLHEQSHGESFMALVEHRFALEGLYILDEPEAALSIRRQIQLLRILQKHVESGSQLIIATHSPILMALPGAWIYQLGDEGIRRVSYQETEAYRLALEFLSAIDEQ